jgi:hypothetical protein
VRVCSEAVVMRSWSGRGGSNIEAREDKDVIHG